MWLASVKELRVYPLKSARGTSLRDVPIERHGLQFDRQWLLVDERGRFITQRTHPRLATLPVSARDGDLELGPVADLPKLTVAKPDGNARREVEIWSHRGVADDAGNWAADWCSRFLGQPVRLVYAGAGLKRIANPEYTADDIVPVDFADGYPILVANQSSLDELSQHMGTTLSMNAFRPNIVLQGLPPWTEDRIQRIEIGPVTIVLCKPCVRCVIPSIDQQTGLAGPNPTPTLKKLRWNRQLRGVTFGENAYALRGNGAHLQVGMEARCLPREENGTTR